MEPALELALLWLAFAATHIGLASSEIRAALVRRLGERAFATLFSVVASVAFAVMVRFYATHRLDGAPGLGLGTDPAVRTVLIAAMVVGLLLTAGSLVPYSSSAYAMGSKGGHEARGLERITRHPFFVGVGLAFGAHALLAPHLIGTVFCAGLAILALAGSWHQDRKLLARRGPEFGAFLRTTSLIPFAAIVAGRQRLVLRELPWSSLAIAVPLIVFLRLAHDGIFAHGGIWVIAVVVGGSGLFLIQDLVSARRQAQRRTATATGAATPVR